MEKPEFNGPGHIIQMATMTIQQNLCKTATLKKRPQIGFQDQFSLNADQKYCRMLQGEHSAILSTFIKLLFGIKNFILSTFEWPFYTGFTVYGKNLFKIISCELEG